MVSASPGAAAGCQTALKAELPASWKLFRAVMPSQSAKCHENKKYMITTEIQQAMPEDVGLSRFTGVCGLDGHSLAPRDGFMASRERGEADIGFNAEN